MRRHRWQRQHRGPIGVEQIHRPSFDRAHHPGVRAGQPVAELSVEVVRGGEVSAGHERGFEEPVASLDDTLGLRDPVAAAAQCGRQRPNERCNPVGAPLPAADAGLVVPDQPPRHPPQLWSSSQVANSRSSVRLVGIICPSMNRECAAVITSTGNNVLEPSSSGIFLGGNHRSHCAASPRPRSADRQDQASDTQAAAG